MGGGGGDTSGLSPGGGGGGGGYYGGGGGGGAGEGSSVWAADGGGGGGSSYLVPAATLNFTGVDASDNPTVVITYAVPAGNTDARMSRFAVTHHAGVLHATWRAIHQQGIAGFSLQAAGTRLNRGLLPVHAGAHYSFTMRYHGHGPYTLTAYLRAGGSITIRPG
jgi:hypothetical protein